MRRMIVSRRWLQVALLTFAAGFTVLGLLAWLVYHQQPPVPRRVLAEDGRVLFTYDDIMAGQHVFQKYGLMQYGTLFGHGAYLGPDFTAQYLHRGAEAMRRELAGPGVSSAEVDARVLAELRSNRHDAATGDLTFGRGQRLALAEMRTFYAGLLAPGAKPEGLRTPTVADDDELRSLVSYLAWAAWTTTAQRPGKSYSYTNNWPPELLAGNAPTPAALLWSALSLIALLGGTGVVFYLFGRYDILGWKRTEEGGAAPVPRIPEQVALSPAQTATAWYFLVVAGLFLAQGLLGGVNAHYHAEPSGFYGLAISSWLPYNLSRTWHLQLAVFFVATSYLAMGIFIAPLITGQEPRGQRTLALVLFGALTAVVVGSLLGEAASYHNLITRAGPWFWLGSQGWEYLDLGRLWQLLLVVGMALWVVILWRGLRARLPGEHPGNLPWLLLYSALSIPLFYAAGMLFSRDSHFAVVDFWRFWVVHLWVEDFLELFTTLMVAYIFVLIGVVREATATRVVYLDVILYSIGGVIGTMHHEYFTGTPEPHMALGAFFSAMEVIPLMLLSYEAWRFIQLGKPVAGTASEFPHRWAVMFLIAVGFWNFLGAGVFGFLINLPLVSYYEVGTQFTANHGHAAMMGVYGMLAVGFFVFVARHFITPDRRSERAMKISFWGLNIGLAWMVFVNLVPVGLLQLWDSLENGYWHAREPEFFARPLLRVFEWLRLPGDAVFIAAGILPLCYLAIRMFRARRRPAAPAPETLMER